MIIIIYLLDALHNIILLITSQCDMCFDVSYNFLHYGLMSLTRYVKRIKLECVCMIFK